MPIAAFMGGTGTPVPVFSGFQEGLQCLGLNVVFRDLGWLWGGAKFATSSETFLG